MKWRIPEEAVKELNQKGIEAEEIRIVPYTQKRLHSEMKKIFSKSTYIQTNNHGFMEHMDVDSFEVEIEEISDQQEFKFSKDGPKFKNVKKGDVLMTYDSQFGTMTINQTCYAVEEEGEWKIIWDYNF